MEKIFVILGIFCLWSCTSSPDLELSGNVDNSNSPFGEPQISKNQDGSVRFVFTSRDTLTGFVRIYELTDTASRVVGYQTCFTTRGNVCLSIKDLGNSYTVNSREGGFPNQEHVSIFGVPIKIRDVSDFEICYENTQSSTKIYINLRP